MLDSKKSSQILACDIGLKRIGLAQYLQGIILPLPPILRKNRIQASNELSALLEQKHITTLVVGMPSGGEAKYQDMAKRIQHFVTLLTFYGDIVYVNEDYTSKEASAQMHYMRREKRAKAQKDGKLDSLSACYILERYLSN